MIPVIIFALAFILILVIRKQNRLQLELIRLSAELKDMRELLVRTYKPDIVTPEPTTPVTFVPSEKRAPEPKPEPKPIPEQAPPRIRKPSRFAPLWEQAKTNWAGVLGSFILLIGISFFAFLASTRIGPAGRFACIVIGSVVFGAGGHYLRRLPRWQDFSSWLFGIAGTAFLIATLGAGGLSPLRFIDDPLIAMALLALGIAVNLGLAYFVREQFSTSFHALISLCGLAFAPAHDLILMAGAITTLAGLGLAYRRAWDRNNFLILLGYLAFHLYLFSETTLNRGIGMSVALVIGLSAAAIHYDKIYSERGDFLWPLLAHLLNWIGLAFILSQYSAGFPWAGFILISAGIGLILIARYARKQQITWLFHADSMIGFLLVLVGLFQLERLHVELDLILALGICFSGYFSLICLAEKENILGRVALGVEAILYLALLLSPHPKPFVLLAATAMTTLQSIAIQRRQWANSLTWKNLDASNGLLFMALTSTLVIQNIWAKHIWGSSASAAIGLALMLALRPSSLAAIRIIMGALVIAHAQLFLLPETTLPVALESLCRFGPFLLLDLLIILRSRIPALMQLACYLAAAVWAGSMNAATFSSSHYVPSLLMLASSLILFELGIFLAQRPSEHRLPAWILQSAAGFLALFLLYHGLVNIQSSAMLGGFTIRSLIGIAGIGTLAYWLMFAPALHLHQNFPSWMTWLWEGLLLLVLLPISLELDLHLRPLAIAGLGLFVFTMVLRAHWPERLALYSWLLFIFSGIQLSYVLAGWPDLTQGWSAVSLSGWLTLLVHILQVVITYRSRFWLNEDRWGRIRAVARWHNWFNFYPVILFAALFFYWHYERSLLTLLWFVEVFVVFVLGLIIREKHFVKISYFFLACCAGRLLLNDLAQSDLAVRAGVFVVCGLLMLGINALQRKFQHRLETPKEPT